MITKGYSPVRINKGQQQEMVDIFKLLPEDKQRIMRITLDILGWDVTTHPRLGLRLERQS